MLLAEGDFFIKKWMKNKRVANIYGRKWAWLMLRGMEVKVSATLNMQGFICLCFCNTFLKKYEKENL